MSSEQELGVYQLSFIGKILETFGHDLRNHLAVIREYNGLMYDISEQGKMDKKQVTQCRETMKSIDLQIDKTLSLIFSFDVFSRGMHLKNQPCNLNETIDNLLVLMHRSTSQRKVTIEKVFSKKVPGISCAPIDLQCVIFYCIEELMIHMPDQGGCIAVTTMCSDEAVTVSIKAKAPLAYPLQREHSFPSLPLLRIVEGMGAALSRHPEHHEISLTMQRHA